MSVRLADPPSIRTRSASSVRPTGVDEGPVTQRPSGGEDATTATSVGSPTRPKVDIGTSLDGFRDATRVCRCGIPGATL